MRFCAVAVDAATFAIDRPYTYALPGELDVQVGCRVLVPFGRGNRTAEGMVLAFPEQAPDGPVKAVLCTLDQQPVLSAGQIQLASWMRERLYCTFYDCVRAILPAALWLDLRDTYTVQVSDAELELRKAQGYGPVLQAFDRHKTRTRKQLRQSFAGRFPAAQLNELCEQGVLLYQSGVARRAQDKRERWYRLALPDEEAMRRAQRPRSHPARQDVVACLSGGRELNRQALQYQTGVSENVLAGMVKSGLLEVVYRERLRAPDFSDVPPAPLPTLSEKQQAAYEGLRGLLFRPGGAAALLHGVTGSGKTQIYLRLIADALQAGRTALALVPEIGLTPQLTGIFAAHFGGQLAVLHSAMSDGERYDSWKKIRSGQARVVVGARSAVFAPLQNLGVIVLDEEQDGAYQADQGPRYHARDVARFLARRQGALLVLGSATPSVESYYRAEQGRYALFSLPERYGEGGLPEVTVADMRGLSRKGLNGSIGPVLHQALETCLARGEQAILFLNRRGDSRTVGCAACGWTPDCPSCSTTMTYHSANGRAMCHYCGASIRLGHTCPACGSPHLFMESPGTQRVERELHQKFPGARVLRMDADTTTAKHAHEALLSAFGRGQADILLGTQMVTKGLDFARVTLVGVLDADQSLYAPDFRAHERTFSLITQVVGRAGRRDAAGQAVIQTFSPDHPVILSAARQDYLAFYREELDRRWATQSPPICELLLLCASGEHEQKVLAALLRLKERLTSLMAGQFADFRYPVLGPAAASMLRVAGKYRYHLTIRCPDNKRRRQLIAGVLREAARQNRDVSLFAELNPDSM